MTGRSQAKTVTVVTGATPPEPEPEGQSSDGTVKVMTLVDTDESATMLTAGHEWLATGEGLQVSESVGDEWMIGQVAVTGDGISAPCTITSDSPDDRSLTISCQPDIAEPGDYEVGIKFSLVRHDGEDTEHFVIHKMLHVPQS